MMFFVSLAWLFALADRRAGALARLPLGGGVRRRGHRIQVLGRVHPRRHRRRASGRATPSARRGSIAVAGSRGPLRGLSPLVMCALTFAIINPMAFLYYRKFRQDIVEQIVNPLTGGVEADLDRAVLRCPAAAVLVHDQPVVGLRSRAGSVGPCWESPGFSGGRTRRDDRRCRLSADLLSDRRRHRPRRWPATRCRWRRRLRSRREPSARSCSIVRAGGRVGHRRDRRRRGDHGVLCARLHEHLPIARRASCGVGLSASRTCRQDRASWSSRRTAFRRPARTCGIRTSHGDHVLWGANTRTRRLLLALHARCLRLPVRPAGPAPSRSSEYIQSRLDLVDFIVMDDFYVQLYQHLPEDGAWCRQAVLRRAVQRPARIRPDQDLQGLPLALRRDDQRRRRRAVVTDERPSARLRLHAAPAAHPLMPTTCH